MVNYPLAKGNYEALLQVVRVLDEVESMSPQEVADTPRLRHFGYSSRDGTILSPSGNNTHGFRELHEVLEMVETVSGGDLRLTKSVEDPFLEYTSGEEVAKLLTQDMDSDVKRARIAAIIMRKLVQSDISLEDGQITNAFGEFLTTIWGQQESETGRIKVNWGMSGFEREMSTGWQANKLKFHRNRGIDIGILRREEGSGRADNLLPVLCQDIFEVVLHRTLKYYEAQGEETPEFDDFYETINNEWYPIPRDLYENRVLRYGPLMIDREITQEDFPILYNLLEQEHRGDIQKIKVRWLEGEGQWSDQITQSEFELEVTTNE
jgi:hypothetical protein